MAEESKQEETATQIVETTYKGENLLKTWTPEQREARIQELVALAEQFTLSENRDTYRGENPSSHGGFELRDPEQTAILRSAITEIIAVSF